MAPISRGKQDLTRGEDTRMFTKRYRTAVCLIVAATLCSLLPAGSAQDNGKMALFNCKEGSFSVMMPGEPEHTAKDLTSPAGPTTLHSYQVNHGPATYIVAYSDYAQVDAAKSLVDVVNGQAKSLEGKVVSDKSLTVNGHPGRRVRIESKDFIFLTMVVVSGNRLYQVLFVIPQGAEPPPRAEEFLSSFKIP